MVFCVECAKCSFPIACVVHSLGCFCVFYEGGGGGGGPKKVFESFPGEGKKKKRRESKSQRLLSSILLFVFFFWASRPLRKIQIVWPHFILFVRMDQHPPPPPQ